MKNTGNQDIYYNIIQFQFRVNDLLEQITSIVCVIVRQQTESCFVEHDYRYEYDTDKEMMILKMVDLVTGNGRGMIE